MMFGSYVEYSSEALICSNKYSEALLAISKVGRC